MMNRTFYRRMCLTAVVLAGCGASSNPDADKAALEQSVRDASRAVVAAEAAQDVAKAVAFYADDAIVQLANAPIAQGKAQIETTYRDFFAMGIESLESTTTKITVAQSGDLAWEYGVNHTRFQTPNGSAMDVGKYLMVWQKVGADWKIAALAVSSDAPPPSASAPASK